MASFSVCVSSTSSIARCSAGTGYSPCASNACQRCCTSCHNSVANMLGKGGGLNNLGGAKVRVIFADHQGDPQKARAEAERLITQEHVVALIGSYQSATAATVVSGCRPL